MSMFDNLFINSDKLPVSDHEKNVLKNVRWITKDFENDLTEIYITDDNKLDINRWEMDTVPKKERPFPDDDGIKGLLGSLKRINERLERIDYHGYIYFGQVVNEKRYEFKAKFTDGILQKVEISKE